MSSLKDQVIFLRKGESLPPITVLSDRESRKKEPQSAYNEETGEINWDCPCIKGALEPPCGDTFRTTFECFVRSKADPKGADCIQHFAALQKCYQDNKEIYLDNLGDDDDDTDPFNMDKGAGFADKVTGEEV